MATTRSKSNNGAAQPPALPDASSGTDSGNPVQPLHLSELNTRSAKLGCWDVSIFQPGIEEWTYQDKNTQQTKQGAAFRCLLVSKLNPSEYAVAQQNMRSANKTPLEQALKQCAE